MKQPFDKLAGRHVALSLLEREGAWLADRGPEWQPLRDSMSEVMGFLNVMIEHGTEDLLQRIAAQKQSENEAAKPAEPINEQAQPSAANEGI